MKPGGYSAVSTSEVATSDSEKPVDLRWGQTFLFGLSLRDALLELQVPESVKTRFKEPELLPSLREIGFCSIAR